MAPCQRRLVRLARGAGRPASHVKRAAEHNLQRGVPLPRKHLAAESAVNYIDKHVLLGIAISFWIALALILANYRG
jgi:hypothetical protein